MNSNGTVQVRFSVPQDGDPIIELMHATVLGGGKYRLENSPFYAYGVSFEDVVSANSESEGIVFSKVVARGGHSTYRVKLPPDAESGNFLAVWPELESLGCTYEGSVAGSRPLYAIDVPPGCDIKAVYRILELREKDGTWEFEEAHYYAGDPIDRLVQ